jgi:hypothetical protein
MLFKKHYKGDVNMKNVTFSANDGVIKSNFIFLKKIINNIYYNKNTGKYIDVEEVIDYSSNKTKMLFK